MRSLLRLRRLLVIGFALAVLAISSDASGATIPYLTPDGAQFALGDTVTINKEDEAVWPITCVASPTGTCAITEGGVQGLYPPGVVPPVSLSAPPKSDVASLFGGLRPNFGRLVENCDPPYTVVDCQIIPVGQTVSAYFYAAGYADKDYFAELQNDYRAWLVRRSGTVYGNLCATGDWMVCKGQSATSGPLPPAKLAEIKVDATHALHPLPLYVSVSNFTVDAKGHGTIRVKCRDSGVRSCRIAVVATAPGGTSASYFIGTAGEPIIARGATRTVALPPSVHAAPSLWDHARSSVVEVDACDTARPYCVSGAFQGRGFRADLEQETGQRLPVLHR